MDKKNALIFLKSISDGEILDHGEWLMGACPFKAYLHSNGTDSRPSFGVSINNEGGLVYHCFTCCPDVHPIERLLHNFWLLTGKYPYGLADLFSKLEGGSWTSQDVYKKEYKDVWEAQAKVDENPECLTDEELDDFPLIDKDTVASSKQAYACRDYLVSRDVSFKTIRDLGVRYWVKNGSIIFPHTDCNGNIFVLRHRGIHAKVLYTITAEMAKSKRKQFPMFSNSGAWFGMHIVDWSKTVVLVEGCIDVLRLHELGLYNCIASGSAYAHKKQFEALTCSSVISGYDMDKAGMIARKRCIKFLKGKMLIHDINWGLARSRKGGKCKDAGDLADRKGLVNVLKNKVIVN